MLSRGLPVAPTIDSGKLSAPGWRALALFDGDVVRLAASRFEDRQAGLRRDVDDLVLGVGQIVDIEIAEILRVLL